MWTVYCITNAHRVLNNYEIEMKKIRTKYENLGLESIISVRQREILWKHLENFLNVHTYWCVPPADVKLACIRCASFVDDGTDVCSQILRYRIFLQKSTSKNRKVPPANKKGT